jgi:hypothetical protein
VAPSPQASDAKIVGCWRQAGQPGILHVRSDGTFVSGGIVRGTWVAANPSAPSYAFQFPDDIYYGEISEDGTKLVNAEIPIDPLTRISGTSSNLVGVWRWASGLTLDVQPNGTFTAATLRGRWKLVDPGRRKYMFAWEGMKPIVTVSPAGDSVKFVDLQRNVVVDLQRLPC